MRQPGEITQAGNGMMQITFCRPEACAACNACEGGKKEHHIWVRGEGRVGDIALVEMPDSMVAKASFLAYGMPLATLLAGMVAGYLATGGGDGGAAVGALAGLAAGLLALKGTEKKRAGRPEWSPRVVDILPRNEGEAVSDAEQEDG